MKTDLVSAFSENGRISGEIFSQIWSLGGRIGLV